jgi:hypothetical protein
VRWATGMRCGPALGGEATLGSVATLGSGNIGDHCGVGVSSNTTLVGVAFWKWLARKAGAGVWGTDAGSGGGTQRGNTRRFLFTVILFERMKRVVTAILRCDRSGGRIA